MRTIPPSARLRLAAGVWVLLAVAGCAFLARYSQTPSLAADPPAFWPLAARIHRAPDRATLVMLVHPQCGCSAASLEELARFLAQHPSQVEAHVIFLRPAGYPDGWERTALWRSASQIPGVRTWVDPGGLEIARLGAWTSGLTLLYNAAGVLRFSGGITEGRGHAGDNPGLDRLAEALMAKTGPPLGAAVFGCSLRTAHARS